MKKAFALTLVLIAAVMYAPAPAAQESGSDQQAQETIQKMMHEWPQAAKDKNTAPLESMLAEDFTHTGPGGQMMTREDFVSKIKDGTFKIESLDYENVKVRVYGNAAVATGRLSLKGSWEGNDVSGDYAFTDTYIRHGDKWQEVAGQVTRCQNQ